MEAEPDALDPQKPVGTPTSPPRPPLWRRFGVRVTAGVVLYVIVGAILLAKIPDRLLADWFPTLDEKARAAFLGPAANVVLFALGGTIALVGVGLSLSRHRQELEAAERDRQAADRDRQRLIDDRQREQARRDEVDAQRRIDTERALRERFVTTVKLLSDPAPVNRHAALFALGALADDWDAFGKPDEVQVCIEVLTGYLRAPRSNDMLLPLDAEEARYLEPDDYYDAQRTNPQEVSVKQAGYTVIRNHLQCDASPNWHGRQFNLSRAYIDFPVELLGALVSGGGGIDLSGARIDHRGSVDLASVQIRGGSSVDLRDAVITGNGTVDLQAAEIDHGHVYLTEAAISRGQVNLSRAKVVNLGSVVLRRAAIRTRGRVDLRGATIRDGGNLDLMGAAIRGDEGILVLRNSVVGDGGSVDLTTATIGEGGRADLKGISISARGSVDLSGVEIGLSGRMDFRGAAISHGANVDIDAVMIRHGGDLVRPNGFPSRKARSSGSS